MMCAAAEAVAGSVPGVRAVSCQGAGGSDAREEPRALFPRVGQEVYASQTRLGHVERVIIHPRHRRVTALVVQGRAAGRRGDEGGGGRLPAQPDQGLIIPVDAVRVVTEAAVLLRIDAAAARRYADRRLRAYAPEADWQPPYPYTRGEVLLERERWPVS
jgi:sporulation protein YlmC with PRC-barrel domain